MTRPFDPDQSLADYPVMLQLKGRRCVVVGAGAVGRRKLQSLLASGARIVLIAPEAADLDLPDGIETVSRSYEPGDFDGAALVFAATDDPQTNHDIAACARARHIPVNIADDPHSRDFTLPAVSRHDRLTVAVGTGGASPAAAALVRDRLAGELGPGWAQFVEIAAKLRQRQLTSEAKCLYNQQVLHNLLERGLIRMLESGDRVGLERLLASELTDFVSLDDLDISLPKGAS